MHEWKEDSRSTKQPDLDERLAAFYGPQLREQPLSSSSWHQLRSQLGPQRPPGRRRMLRLRTFWHKGDHSDPAYIRETFSRVMHEARVSYPLSLLQCSFKANVQVPSMRISAFGWHKIKLVLPSATEKLINQPELDVLVATSLARYRFVRKPIHVIVHILIAIMLLLAYVAAILYSKHNFLIVLLPIAISLCVLWLLHVWGRKLAFRADAVVVQWLGRERTCQGLHALANRSRSPSRSRWGEPSLAERIKRVCGTQVTIEEDRLMLVR